MHIYIYNFLFFNQSLCFKQKLVESIKHIQIQPTVYAELTYGTLPLVDTFVCAVLYVYITYYFLV